MAERNCIVFAAPGADREEFGRYVGPSLVGRPNCPTQTASVIAFLLCDAAQAITYKTFTWAASPLA